MAADIDHDKQMKAHAGTYDLFIWMMKWGTLVSAVVALVVVLLISS